MKVTIQCDACLEDYEADEWDAKHGLRLCDSCTDEFANESSNDVFESALWAKAGPR